MNAAPLPASLPPAAPPGGGGDTWPALLGAVRRHLWTHRGLTAVRHAAWAGAALALALLPVHLALAPLPPISVALLAAALALAALAWTAARRPDDAACALWADRELAGASAFTTLLEARRGRLHAADAAAVQGLERWTAARVPAALARLAARRTPTRLARPLTALAVCSALALVVLALPAGAPAGIEAASAPAAASSSAQPPQPRTPDAAPRTEAAPAAGGDLADQVASALRRSAARDDPRTGGDARETGVPGDGAPRAGAAAEPGANPPPPGATATGQAAPMPPTTPGAPNAADAVNTSSAPPSGRIGASSGREAGDGADTRAEAGLSRVPRGTMALARRAAVPERPGPDTRRAAAGEIGSYDDVGGGVAARAHGGEPVHAAAAATPPAVADPVRLTPHENHYVRAWMTAIAGPHRH